MAELFVGVDTGGTFTDLVQVNPLRTTRQWGVEWGLDLDSMASQVFIRT
jgi:hypothetical protein